MMKCILIGRYVNRAALDYIYTSRDLQTHKYKDQREVFLSFSIFLVVFSGHENGPLNEPLKNIYKS